nr:PQQ-dependent sugar dehydrogenase [Acetobacter fallax]
MRRCCLWTSRARGNAWKPAGAGAAQGEGETVWPALRRALICLLIFPVLSLLFGGEVRAQPDSYIRHGVCDGFPRVDLRTSEGLCVGLVASGINFPRGVAVKGSTIYIADMGGWHHDRGRLLAFDQNGHGQEKDVLTGLDRPDGLALAADGQLYIGLPGHILRVLLRQDGTATGTQEVMTGLPLTGRNVLTALAADPGGGLYLSAGSATNNCESGSGKAPDASRRCPELNAKIPRASILWFRPGETVHHAGRGDVVATGLRNPMALTVMPDGVLLAAVNSRDSIDSIDPELSDDDLPHDTFHIIRKGRDYGWPYCFDNDRPAPEYPDHSCAAVPRPDLLLGPHSAPLGMIFYDRATLPGLKNRVLMAYHGYRAAGHQVVSLAVDVHGRPQGEPMPLVRGWQDLSDSGGPPGSPVGLAVMGDGTVLITDDHNGTLLRLAKE